MKRTFAILWLIACLSLVVSGQNLVQNPSFENLPTWDEFWVLSLTAPSTATAVATQVTTDAHEGTTSLELSNTVNNSWTYYYTDDVNAPISLLANKKYEVRGWMRSVEEGKGAEFAIFWNGSSNSHTIYGENPDPVSNPDWFMVKDTITPLTDVNDAYLRLGLRADRAGDGSGQGRLLFDDFSVTLIPDGNETEIEGFSFPGQVLPEIIDPGLGTISIEMPFGTDLSTLAPDIIVLSAGASISPGIGEPQNFNNPVVYTVTALDGITTRNWTVTVTISPPNSASAIISFSLPELIAPATINGGVQLVLGRVPYGTDVTTLVPSIEVSPGASIDPVSGIPTDFTNPVTYIVVAENGTTSQDWVAAILVEQNTETDITSFDIPELLAPTTIDNSLHTVVGSVPFGTDLSALVPSIGVSGDATIDPVSDVVTDFSAPVIYRVTADDGTTFQDWTVTITTGPASTETDITLFSIPELAAAAIIDNSLHTIVGTVPYGTDLSALAPTIDVSTGATISPASDVARDFSSSLTYTVTAQDGTTQMDWVVSIQVLPNTATDITSFDIPELVSAASIDNLLHTVVGTVPYRTNVTALVPTIEVSPGATINPLSGASTDFSSPVAYTVTADDGTTMQDWEVSVLVAPNTETDITDFSLAEQTADATFDLLAHTVTIEVASGTNLGFLTPIISVSPGATIDPLSGVSRDFTLGAPYTVTAEDGITVQVWTVTVTLAPANTETDITVFSIPQLLGPVTIDNSLHTVIGTVAYGVDLTARVPTIGLSRGATIDPGSGTVTDLSSPVTYTVTAEDGTTTQDWLVTIQDLPNTVTEITSFDIPELVSAASIDNLLHTVMGTVPYGTNVTTLVPTIDVSAGASISPASDVARDFSSSLSYTVTAEDGTTTQDWLVTIQALPNTETDITEFSFAEETGASTINRTDHTIVIEVASGTDLTSLAPTISVSPGATIDPADGVSRDFSSSVDYIVTAEDGITSQNWNVSVSQKIALDIGTRNAEAIKIYPNPATDFVFIELSRETHIRFHDLMGKLCYSEDHVNGDKTINVSNFKKGIYIVSLYWGDGSLQQRKVIIQ